jgi:hypothetical protein
VIVLLRPSITFTIVSEKSSKGTMELAERKHEATPLLFFISIGFTARIIADSKSG